MFFSFTRFRNKWEQSHWKPLCTKVPITNPRDRAASSCTACPWQCPPQNALAELFPNTKACKSKAGGEEQSSAAQLHRGCGSFAHLPWGTGQSLFLLCCLGIPLLVRGKRSSTAPGFPSLSLLSFQGNMCLTGILALANQTNNLCHKALTTRFWG